MAIRYPVKIASAYLTTTTTTVSFSDLSQQFDELLIKIKVRGAGSYTNNDCFGSFSNQVGSDHTQPIRLSSDGSTVTSGSFSAGAGFRVCQMPGASSTANNFASAEIKVPNYKSTSPKVFWTQGGYSITGQTSYTDQTSGRYSASSAITSIRFDAGGGAGFAAGSVFTVYGIYNVQSEATPYATGGQVYTDSTYFYHVFKTSGIFTPSQSITSDILVIAGGGGGGGYSGRGGGGGAGGLVAHSSQSLTAQEYAVIVGAGGGGGVSSALNASSGNNSQFASLTAAVGGGRGGGGGTTTYHGATGGSGGGGFASGGNRGDGTVGQGSNGGAGDSSGYGAGGGGGAGANGSAGSGNNAGAGGIGSSSYSAWGLATSTGENSGGTYYYAGGGSGGFTGTAAIAGLGGGGVGANAATGTNGTANTGGGGGGGNNGGLGGSGIVIVRYAR